MKWKMIKLGDAATFVNGYPFKPTEWSETGLEIIRIQDLTGNGYELNLFDGKLDEKYLVKKGDLLISWSASLGVYEWQKENGWLNQHIFKVVFDKLEWDKSFFMHLISLQIGEMEKQVHGATMKHITKKKFDVIAIPYPPLPIQQKIAAILDRADALRQKDKQLLVQYDALAQSVFYTLFGDPVKNERGFDKGTIRDLVSEVKYGTSKPAENEGEFPYLRMNNITYSGAFNFTDLKYINLEEKEKEKYLVRNGDLLFNRTNSKELVGKTAVYKGETEMAIAGYLIRVRTNERANTEYISAYLNSSHGKMKLMSMCKSIVGMANINAQELQDIPILIPPIELQTQFATIISNIEEQKNQATQQLQKSEELFQSLLQRAFKGELVE